MGRTGHKTKAYLSCCEKSSLVSSSSQDSSHRCLVVSPLLAASVSSTGQSVHSVLESFGFESGEGEGKKGEEVCTLTLDGEVLKLVVFF